MTRSDAISTLESDIRTLSDERLGVLAEIVRSWARPSVYSTLSPAERAKLEGAVDSLDRGEGIALETVDAELELLLKSHGA